MILCILQVGGVNQFQENRLWGALRKSYKRYLYESSRKELEAIGLLVGRIPGIQAPLPAQIAQWLLVIAYDVFVFAVIIALAWGAGRLAGMLIRKAVALGAAIPSFVRRWSDEPS